MLADQETETQPPTPRHAEVIGCTNLLDSAHVREPWAAPTVSSCIRLRFELSPNGGR